MNGAMPWLADLHTPEEDRWFMRDVVLQDEVWVADVDGRPVGFVALGVVFTRQVWQSYFDITRAVAPAITAFVLMMFAPKEPVERTGVRS